MGTNQRILLLIGVFALFLNAGVPTHSAAEQSPKESEKTTLRFRLAGTPSTLDWNLAYSMNETQVIVNLMEGLVEEGADLQPKPALAQKWDISADGKIYVFTLRPGVHWSDGKPLRAQEFVDSWIRLLDPRTKAPYANFLYDVVNAKNFHDGKTASPAQVGIRAIDDQHLEVKLNRVVPYFIHIPTFWVTFPIRNDLIRKFGKQWTAPAHLVTLGPYQLTQWTPSKNILLKKNPTYYAASNVAPNSPREVMILIQPDNSKTLDEFLAGKIDFLQDPTTDDLTRIQAYQRSAFRVAQFPYLATFFLGFNTHIGPLKNGDVRKALSLSIDRSKISSALQTGEIAATGLIPPGLLGHLESDSVRAGASARPATLFSRAGYPDGQGLPRFRMAVIRFDHAAALASLIADSFKVQGISVETRILGPDEYVKEVKSGNAPIYIGQWGADYPDPDNFYQIFTSESGFNRTAWKNPQYDSLVKAAGEALDPSVRLKAYAAAERILVTESNVIVPLFYKKITTLIRSRVKRIEITPLNYLLLKNVIMKN